ncbi:alpha-1,6-mannosylglycoprotein 6-beta-N-acetylglucosaminyltransferase A [Echinops telfairi]|uniref:Alpha-1,6-mannosylglycoprotein 6-beta-N-acetylglucosaminyltransferase A n=1 Tax=Echinops telfairi TaxID=9371 RepID=A0AC55CV30_ECHTE|nr:alpha-1,6-mannosylglycoprotein 6-beta-N-acetylglucosaminyltransferase A [Echinops telfairi]
MALFTPWKLSSQKLGFFLVTFGFIWGMMLLHFTIQQRTQPESSSVLCEQILDLSKRYIKALADENRNVVDGPYAGVMTAYDLKKTLAVLLDNILQRIGKLESKVDNLVINGTGTNLTNSTTAVPSLGALEKINVADIINGAQEKCVLPPMDGYPHCEGKIKWMQDMWRSDPCYADYGVDGSTCSFFIYLSEVENWCPHLPWRAKNPYEEADHNSMILVHLGLLTKESGFKIAETAFSGGPLGELVQWSDLITSLYLLGHDIRISASLAELKEIMKKVVGNRSGCPTVGDRIVELIYIDIVGLAQFKKTLGPSWVHYQCMLRVLDSFGTEPEFNHANYAQSKGHKTPWGKWNLNPQQFYTMFPHTPDNSFLGFVVEQHLNSSDIYHINEIKRQNQSLVYGKVDSFWKNKKLYLDIIHMYMEVHATVHGSSTKNIPSYVKNHGILSGRDLQFLLRETKLFVGLGFPYEGPAPLEAIANGCAFLNPKFNPPKSSKNTDFFIGKPTLREVSFGQNTLGSSYTGNSSLWSAHPYAEVFIGRPHVWTVDLDSQEDVEEAVKAILNQKIEPYMPYEFTCEGMLQRINAFIEKQDFCHGQVMWPPLSALQVKLAEPGTSCKQVCQESQLICEPSFFQHLNRDKDLLKYKVICQSSELAKDILVPSFDPKSKHCVFQGDLLLFSCAGAHPKHQRICPCRDFIKGQVALCGDCL